MSYELASFLMPLVAFLLAGAVKGLVGLGLPTVAIGLLSLVMSPADAAALIVAPSLLTNLWQMADGRMLGVLARRLWPMLAALCIGVWAGSGVLAEADAEATSTALGAILALYALIGLSFRQMPRLPFRHEGWLGPLAGGATGLVTAVTGVFVVPSVPYLQALGLERDHLVQALGLTFTVATLALAASLVDSGAMNVHSTSLYSLVILASLTGMVIGRAIRSKIAAHNFRRAFLIGLLLLGCSLILK